MSEIETQIAEYSKTAAALADLRARYSSVVYDVTTTSGMKSAKEGRAELRTLRVELEKERVRIKAPALERSRLIDAEAKRITAAIVDLETPIDEQIKAEEARKAAEKAAAERAEAERVAAVRRRIDAIRSTPLALVGRSVDEIKAAADKLRGVDLSGLTGADLAEAEAVRVDAIDRLAMLAVEAQAAADEAARLADERAELERLREAEKERAAEAKRIADAERAEADRVAREAREMEEARLQAERDAEQKRAEDARRAADAERAEADRKAAEERARLAREQEAENARLAAERAEADRIAREKLEAEAERLRQERAEFDRRAAAERERQEAEKAEALRAEIARLEAEKRRAIETATLTAAAADAVELLRECGQGAHVVTLSLESALRRETKGAA